MIDPAAPGKSFEMLWAELSAILLPGCKVEAKGSDSIGIKPFIANNT